MAPEAGRGDRRGSGPSRGGSGAGRSSGGQGGSRGGSSSGRSGQGGAGRGRDDQGRGAGAGRPERRGGSSGGRPPYAGKGGSDSRGGSSSRPFSRGRRDDAVERSEDQARYDGPPIPEEVTGKELDRSVLAQLQSLPEKLAQRVARHLVAAGLVMAEDPKTAYEHTLAARARAGRLAVVREAVGEAAYAAGEFAEALTELRAARRINGAKDYLAMMADCERALGRPDRALELVRAVNDREALDNDLQAELTIVEAGARRDRGEIDAALRTLEKAPLTSKSRQGWVVRLRYAYADTLLAAGRTQDALAWFHRTEAIDGEETTDAAERAAQVEADLAKKQG